MLMEYLCTVLAVGLGIAGAVADGFDIPILGSIAKTATKILELVEVGAFANQSSASINS